MISPVVREFCNSTLLCLMCPLSFHVSLVYPILTICQVLSLPMSHPSSFKSFGISVHPSSVCHLSPSCPSRPVASNSILGFSYFPKTLFVSHPTLTFSYCPSVYSITSQSFCPIHCLSNLIDRSLWLAHCPLIQFSDLPYLSSVSCNLLRLLCHIFSPYPTIHISSMNQRKNEGVSFQVISMFLLIEHSLL